MLAHHLITEFIGQCQFSKNQEDDIQIAESIASRYYQDLYSLIDTCRGYAETRKFKKAIDKAGKEALKPDSWFMEQILKEPGVMLYVYPYWKGEVKVCLTKGSPKKDPEHSSQFIILVDTPDISDVYVEWNPDQNRWEFIDGYLSLL